MSNIVFVCHDYKLSGANASLIDLIEENNNNNYYCILPRHNKEMEIALKEKSVKVIVGYYTVPVNNLNSNITRYIKDLIKYLYSMTFNYISLFAICLFLKKRNIDIIHSNSFATIYGAQLARKLKVRHIWHIREFGEEDHQFKHFKYPNSLKLLNNSYRIYISHSIEKKYQKILNNNCYKVIYDKIYYDKNYVKQKELYENEIVIMIAGTIAENKGQMYAIKATESLYKKGYKLKLLICGEGPNKLDLEKYVQKNNLNYIYFLGQVKNLNEVRKNVDIALVCSKNEALGRVVVEAMYYENLVIASNSGAIPEYIDDNVTGLLYEKENLLNLIEKLEFAINNQRISKKIISNAKEYSVKKFSNSIYKEIQKIYSKEDRNE